MAKKFDVVAAGGKYKDASGVEKTRWLNIGVVLETEKGLRLKLESLPVGWDGWAMLSEPKQRETTPKRDGGASTMNDDIPWKP